MDEPWFESRGSLSQVLEDFRKRYLPGLSSDDLARRVILRVLLDNEAVGEDDAHEEAGSEEADWLRKQILDVVQES